MVLNSYLQTNTALVEDLLKAVIEGAVFSLSPENKPVVLRTIMKRLKITDARGAEEGYDGVIKTTDLKPYPSVEGLRNMQHFMKSQNPLVANVNVENMIDNRLVRKLDDSGFINEMRNLSTTVVHARVAVRPTSMSRGAPQFFSIRRQRT
jgi:hypothetical protein